MEGEGGVDEATEVRACGNGERVDKLNLKGQDKKFTLLLVRWGATLGF